MPQGSPCAGEVYRHFKGKMYKVQGIATHSETSEALVIYQELQGDHLLYARPYESFIEVLDHKKYENVYEKYRFTFIPTANEYDGEITSYNASSKGEKRSGAKAVTNAEAPKADSHIEEDKLQERESAESPMLKFLDTDDFDEKYEILCNLKKQDITDILIDNLAVTLDVVIPEGSLEKRFDELKTCVKTRKQYESLRLR